MITVAEAEQIVRSQARHYGTETISFEIALGRVLAEDLLADRDLPPCNRVTMDGIAIRYTDIENGIGTFRIRAVMAAGDAPANIDSSECVEIMTGAALPEAADTVVRYEDLEIQNGTATLLTNAIKKGQNIHRKGKDKQKGELVARGGNFIDATIISMAASIGKAALLVYKLPRVVVLSTGDELVDVTAQPTPWQVRRSNSYTIQAALQPYGIHADRNHLPDEPLAIKDGLTRCLAQYDVILLSGGVSMGKYDYVPQAMEELGIAKLFHKVQQRPGKPFWFGSHASGVLAFAFPGNPVSTFMCLHRYFLPWLRTCIGVVAEDRFAALDADVNFAPQLQYFVQVQLHTSTLGQLLATPMEGNGSGDFANLLETDAFMELPAEESNFKKGTAYRIWPFKRFI